MNTINPRKLKGSKWTAVDPIDRQRHFMVTQVSRNKKGQVTTCLLEAVIDKSSISLDWKDLKNGNYWKIGWHSEDQEE